ncbi:MarR family winged helix-turn-helix transcriptional regulator [Fontibacillus phaseoli]|uniref:MarR family winged helix-turn-helix transcriptional regulator n=1 Tax=Fontibacillus phaseoli TaxID=1416533 RepID=UPI000DF47C37|nr:MarR family transcriptional regulator [Fontibacillus phaseoli]
MVQRETLLEVTTMFGTLIKAISQEWNKRGGEYNVSFPQFKMLHILNKTGQQKVSHLAEKLGLTSAAITGLTDRLLTEGYVTRDRDEKDRRVVYIAITEKGQEIIQTITENHEESTQTIFNTLNDEDIMHLKRIFTAMLDTIER